MNCGTCGAALAIGDWPFCPHGEPHGRLSDAPAHPSERCVVFHNPRTGEISYPATNDWPMSAKKKARGFERLELRTLRDIERFEGPHGVRSEKAWYDRNGRGFDD